MVDIVNRIMGSNNNSNGFVSRVNDSVHSGVQNVIDHVGGIFVSQQNNSGVWDVFTDWAGTGNGQHKYYRFTQDIIRWTKEVNNREFINLSPDAIKFISNADKAVGLGFGYGIFCKINWKYW